MTFHELKVAPRALNRAMRRAIQGDPFKALIELILNSDDSYRRLEDAGHTVSGVIEIEFERERGNGHFAVRDFAEGMSPEEATTKVTGWGDTHSGHAGGSARGFFGRGGKDALFEMAHGELITCKDDVITDLRFTERGGKRGVQREQFPAKAGRRQSIGLASGNGTVASFDLPSNSRVPQLETVREALSTLYSLRNVLSNSNREVHLKHRGEIIPLRYEPPVGSLHSSGILDVSTDAGTLTLAYRIFVAPQELDQANSDRREGGLLIVDEKNAVIDLSLFRFDRDPDAERLFGDVRVTGLRDAMRRDENIVTEERNGFNLQNKSAKQLATAIEALIGPVVREIRAQKKRHDSEQSVKTKKKVEELTTKLNELAARITGEKSGPADGDSRLADTEKPEKPSLPKIVPDPIIAVPSSLTITPRASSRVSVYFDTSRCKGDVIIDVQGSDDVEFTPDQFVIDDAQPVFRHDIEVFGLAAGATGVITVVNDGGELDIPFNVVAEVYPKPPSGFAFVPDLVTASPGRGRTLQLYIDTDVVGDLGDVTFSIQDDAVAHLDRTYAHFTSKDALLGIVRVGVKITGVKVGGETLVTATCGTHAATCRFEVVSRRSPKSSVGGFFSGIEWDNGHSPKCHYRSEDSKMVIHCLEPSFRLLGVSAFTFDRDRAIQVAVAEACTQAACQGIAQASVPGQGKRRAYLHPNDDLKRLEEDYAFIQDLTREVGPVVYAALIEDIPPSSLDRNATVPASGVS